jgi:hypothetical protein
MGAFAAACTRQSVALRSAKRRHHRPLFTAALPPPPRLCLRERERERERERQRERDRERQRQRQRERDRERQRFRDMFDAWSVSVCFLRLSVLPTRVACLRTARINKDAVLSLLNCSSFGVYLSAISAVCRKLFFHLSLTCGHDATMLQSVH